MHNVSRIPMSSTTTSYSREGAMLILNMKDGVVHIDLFSNTGPKGEGKRLLCDIFKRLLEEKKVVYTTKVELHPSSDAKESIYEEHPSLSPTRYSSNSSKLESYYSRTFGFVKRERGMDATVETILHACRNSSGTRKRSRSRSRGRTTFRKRK